MNGPACAEVQGATTLTELQSSEQLASDPEDAVEIGARARVRAARLRFPDPQLELLDQTYERIDDTR